ESFPEASKPQRSTRNRLFPSLRKLTFNCLPSPLANPRSETRLDASWYAATALVADADTEKLTGALSTPGSLNWPPGLTCALSCPTVMFAGEFGNGSLLTIASITGELPVTLIGGFRVSVG